MLRVMASDGVDVAAVDEGSGPCVVIVHGGLGDPQAWGKVAERLRDRFRVVRLHRLAALLPRATVMTLEGQAHGANDSAPDRVAAGISDFAEPLLGNA